MAVYPQMKLSTPRFTNMNAVGSELRETDPRMDTRAHAHAHAHGLLR